MNKYINKYYMKEMHVKCLLKLKMSLIILCR